MHSLSARDSIVALMKKYNLHAKHSFGQHFLIDDEVYKKIIESAELEKNDCVIEIGTGFGTLTKKLAEHAGTVISVEADKELSEVMKGELQKKKNIIVVHGNALSFSVKELLEKSPTSCEHAKIVANIPYNITGRVLRQFIPDSRITRLVLLVQKEVAERMAAAPGEMSMVSLSVQWYAKVRIAMTVPRNNFFPSPEVDSSLVVLTPDPSWRKKLPQGLTEDDVFRLAKIGFHLRRKKLVNSLSAGLHIDTDLVKSMLKQAKIPESARPQELSIEQWIQLAGLS